MTAPRLSGRGTGGVLPVDLVPDVVPLVGRTDDAVVALMAVVMGWWQRDERDGVGR
jgi:hypothetical protein